MKAIISAFFGQIGLTVLAFFVDNQWAIISITAADLLLIIGLAIYFGFKFVVNDRDKIIQHYKERLEIDVKDSKSNIKTPKYKNLAYETQGTANQTQNNSLEGEFETKY